MIQDFKILQVIFLLLPSFWSNMQNQKKKKSIQNQTKTKQNQKKTSLQVWDQSAVFSIVDMVYTVIRLFCLANNLLPLFISIINL